MSYSSAEDDPAKDSSLSAHLSSVHSLLGRFSRATTQQANLMVAASRPASSSQDRHLAVAEAIRDVGVAKWEQREQLKDDYTTTYNDYTLADIRRYDEYSAPTTVADEDLAVVPMATPSATTASLATETHTPTTVVNEEASVSKVKWIDERSRRADEVKLELLRQRRADEDQLRKRERDRSDRFVVCGIEVYN